MPSGNKPSPEPMLTQISPYGITRSQWVNSSPPGQNGPHFADDIFRCIFINEKFCIFTKISLKSVPKGPIDYNPALVQIMAWCRTGNKPLSEPMLTRLTDGGDEFFLFCFFLGGDELNLFSNNFAVLVTWPSIIKINNGPHKHVILLICIAHHDICAYCSH